MDYKDYYAILGVPRDADAAAIKNAFRKLAREHHPDVSDAPDAADRFKDINEAYQVLSDPEKRKTYDRLGSSYQRYTQGGGDPRGFDFSDWFGRGAAGGTAGMSYGDIFGEQTGFSDFFNAIFGEMNSQRYQQTQAATRMRGRDIEQPVEITLSEAYHGATRVLQTADRRLEVRIPRGARTGTRVRIAGEGQPGLNDGAGDLYLKVKVRDEHPYERHGDDLYMDLPVDLYTAVLGGTVSVRTLSGNVTLSIPPESSNGQQIRLRGKGMPALKQPSVYGDLYVRLAVTLPTDLTAQERSLFEELARLRANPAQT